MNEPKGKFEVALDRAITRARERDSSFQDRGVNPGRDNSYEISDEMNGLDDEEVGVGAISIAPRVVRRWCIICTARKNRIPEAKDEHGVDGEMRIDPTAVGLPNRRLQCSRGSGRVHARPVLAPWEI